MSAFRSCVRLALVLACLSICVHAQQSEGSIGGALQVARGAFPSERVLVTLSLRGQPIAQQYADNEGKFYFPGLTSNNYHVVISDAKYRPVDITVDVNTAVQGHPYVNITLTPIEDEPRPAAGPKSVEGANPNVVSAADLSRRFPKEAVREFDQGVKAERDGKTDDARRHYEKTIEKAPDFYPARNNLGSIYIRKSDFGRAEKQFEEAIRLNPTDGSAYFNLANVMLLTNRSDDAIRTVQQGLSHQPTSGFGYFVLGSALSRKGQGAEAERALRRALDLDATQSKAHLELVNLYLRYGQRQGAVSELKVFLKSAPNDPFAPKAREVLAKLESQSEPKKKH